MTPETTQHDDATREQLARRADRFRARGISLTEEIGYGAEPPKMTAEAAEALRRWEALSPSSRNRTEVAAVYCPLCDRALVAIHKHHGVFLGIYKGKGVPRFEIRDHSEGEHRYAQPMPFIMGQTWDTIPCACRCGYGRGNARHIDVRKLFIALNSSPRRHFTAGESPL